MTSRSNRFAQALQRLNKSMSTELWIISLHQPNSNNHSNNQQQPQHPPNQQKQQPRLIRRPALPCKKSVTMVIGRKLVCIQLKLLWPTSVNTKFYIWPRIHGSGSPALAPLTLRPTDSIVFTARTAHWILRRPELCDAMLPFQAAIASARINASADRSYTPTANLPC